MSVSNVKAYLAAFGLDGRVREFDVSSATVELAAEALGTEGARIAKSITLHDADGGCIMILCAGDYKIDNHSFKSRFGFKARMLSPDEALAMTGHAVGGICPFDLPKIGVRVYLDESLRRFDVVYPAAGSASSAVALSCDELFVASRALSWETLCKPRESGNT